MFIADLTKIKIITKSFILMYIEKKIYKQLCSF